MPVNRNALIRYNTINNCLTNRYRLWTLEDLIEACSDALYEFEGIDKGVSKRTVQMDIQMMRSEKIGYNAPIIVKDKKYYTYEDPDYSITNIPLTDKDLLKLTEVADILRQFKGFTHFQELTGMVQRLEDKIHTSKTSERSVIDLEKNENLKGLEHIDPIFKSITSKNCISITYQSFKARTADTFNFHPFLLKEFKNRWFVLGKKKIKANYLLLALDRIDSLQQTDLPVIHADETEIINYFNDVVGVTVNQGDSPVEVRLLLDHQTTPYVLTKPIHHSQRVIEKNKHGAIISLFVQINFELEKEILGFGDSVKVISPSRFRSRIKNKLVNALDIYETDIHESQLQRYIKQLNHKGFAINQHIYTQREVNRIGKILAEHDVENIIAIRQLLKKLPNLKEIIFNSNLLKILKAIHPDLFLVKALYFNKPPQSNWYVTWHQDMIINVVKKVPTEGYTSWTKKEDVIGVRPPKDILDNLITVRIHLDDTNDKNGALSVIPGSHRAIHQENEAKIITSGTLPYSCQVDKGGVQLMKPLLLHASSKSVSNKRRRVIHLEFSADNLADGLEWAEKESIR